MDFSKVECRMVYRFGVGMIRLLRIFKLQKCAIRTMFALGPCDSCRTYFISENILTLPSIYIFQISDLQKNGTIKTAAKSYEYNTRGKSDLQTSTYKLNLFHKNIDYNEPKIFNNLPPEIKSLTQYDFLKNEKNGY